jgi:hypothetical protein
MVVILVLINTYIYIYVLCSYKKYIIIKLIIIANYIIYFLK